MVMKKNTETGARRRNAGFSMIEILVTLFVVALGVLGSASLQALAMKTSQGGQLRSQAVILALDLLERIEANNAAAIAGGYAPASMPTTYPTDCGLNYCMSDELATYDLVMFTSRLQAQLPNASVTISFAGAGPYTYTVQINWVERIAKAAGTTVDSKKGSLASSGTTEQFSYTVVKMFSNRAAVV